MTVLEPSSLFGDRLRSDGGGGGMYYRTQLLRVRDRMNETVKDSILSVW
jgi:hypothetical protein